MPKIPDLIGQTFGRLTVFGRAPRRKNHAYWLCRCACGREKEVYGSDLRHGKTKSCGCLARKHGESKSPTYLSWVGMRRRCIREDRPHWGDYGGRGIRICDRWESYENFVADMGERPAGCTLDRIDNDGDYEPSNCRWATPSEQSRNRRSNRPITVDGETRTIVEWSELSGVHRSTIWRRLKRGWAPREAVFAPLAASNRYTKKPASGRPSSQEPSVDSKTQREKETV